jgi:hypothetical protein
MAQGVDVIYQAARLGDKAVCDNLIEKLNKPENLKD